MRVINIVYPVFGHDFDKRVEINYELPDCDIDLGDEDLNDGLQSIVNRYENDDNWTIDQSGDDVTFTFDLVDGCEKEDVVSYETKVDEFLRELIDVVSA